MATVVKRALLLEKTGIRPTNILHARIVDSLSVGGTKLEIAAVVLAVITIEGSTA